MNRLRFQAQILLGTFGPLAVCALLAVGIASYAFTATPRALALQRQGALSQVAATGVAATLRGYVRLLESVAGELADNAGHLDQQQAILADRTRVLGRFYRGSVLVDVQGTAVAVTAGQEAVLGLNYAFRSPFQTVLVTKQPAFSTVFQDQPGGLNAVVVAVPVLRNGEFAGELAGQFALNSPEWAANLDLLRTPQGGRAYLVDVDGRLVYHADTALIGTSVRDDPALWSLVERGSAQSAILRRASGEVILASVAPIPGIGWWVVTEESWDAVLAPLAGLRWAAGGVLAVGIVLALASQLWVVRRVTRPLQNLLMVGRRVAGGEAYRPQPASGPADVQALINVVNDMVAKLDEQGATLREYALRVLRGQEEERLRLARDLHDETVQSLVALAQRIELACGALEDDPVGTRRQLAGLQEQAYATAGGVRRMSNSLRPSILEDLGLPAALQVITRGLGQDLPATRCNCEVAGPPRRMPPEIELTAFRCVQEAFSNIRRHASSAKHVSLGLFYEEQRILLMVEDDGPGFLPEAPRQLLAVGHLGLAGMLERVQLFDGEMAIESAPGEGTTITLRLPAPPLES